MRSLFGSTDYWQLLRDLSFLGMVGAVWLVRD